MAAIAFESVESRFTILNPQNNFQEEEHRVEVRRDPLLGDTSVYNPFLKDKARAFFGDSDPELVRKLEEETAKTCIFCPERVEKSATRYAADLVPGGRIRRGEALLFPNLFSIGAYHAVVALSTAHFLKLSDHSPVLIANGLGATQDFLRTVFQRDQTAQFVTVNANYLFPAGASLVHPHMQMLATPIAYSYHARVIDACRAYHRKHGRAYHDDLAAEENRAGVRYVAKCGGWHWMAAFAPMGNNEILAVHEAESDFARLSDDDLQQLAEGMARVLAFYEALGHLSFNYSLLSVRQPQAGEGQRCLFKIVNRQNLYPNYRNDDYFLQKILQTDLIINLPEELAAKLRVSF